METRVILTPTKAVQDRLNKEDKKAKLAAKREAAKQLRNEVYEAMDESLRGLNASANYLSSKEGISATKKIVPAFIGKISKGQLLTIFTEIDNGSIIKALYSKLKDATKKEIELVKNYVTNETELSDDDKEKVKVILKGFKYPNLILQKNDGTRRKQFSNSQLMKAAEYITEQRKLESLG